MIDELAHAGPEHLDPGFVAHYDQKQGHPDPAEDVAVFAAHGLTGTSTIVDLGAGTGQFSLAAAQRFGHVVAVDVSPVMLKLLRDRAAAAGLTNLEVVQAGFLSYEHVGPPADGVFTRNALHHLPDFWKGLALERIGRMMRPGAVSRVHDLIYDFQPSEADQVSSGGSLMPPRIRPSGTHLPTSPNTSAPSTAPSGGCSSRCSSRPALRSRPRCSTAGVWRLYVRQALNPGIAGPLIRSITHWRHRRSA